MPHVARPEVLAGAGVDADDGTGVEVLGDLDDMPGRERGRLGPAGGRVAAHARRRLDDRQLDGVGQLDGDDLVVDDQGLDALHVLGHERGQVAEVVGRERELVEVGRVHEMELVGVAVEILDRPALEARLVERVGAAVRLLDARLGLEVARLDLVERGRPSRRWGLDLNLLDHVRCAVDLDDHPALEILGGHHGRKGSLGSSEVRSSTRHRPQS